MKNSLFNSENWIWQPFGKVADFLILSCLWLLMPVMVVPGIAGLLAACILEPVFQTYETGDAGANT